MASNDSCLLVFTPFKVPPTTQLFYVTYRIWQKGWHVTFKIQFKGTGDLIALSWIVRSVGSQPPCQEDTQGAYGEAHMTKN